MSEGERMMTTTEQENKRLRWMIQHYHAALQNLTQWVGERTPVQDEDEPLWWARGIINTWKPDKPEGIDWQDRAQKAEQAIIDAYACLTTAADAAEVQMGNFPATQFKRALVGLRRVILARDKQQAAMPVVEHDGKISQLDKVKQALLELDRMGFPAPERECLVLEGGKRETIDEATERRDRQRWNLARSLLRKVIVQDGKGMGWPDHRDGDEEQAVAR